MLKWLANFVVTSLLFFPDEEIVLLPQDLGLTAESAEIQTEDGVKLHAWYLAAKNPSPGSTTLLFLHGNAGNISSRLPKAKGWVERNVSVLLLDYRGYGKSDGDIAKEADLHCDARAAVKWLKEKKGVAPAEIIINGESLGSAPAIELAAGDSFKGLILEAPFTSLADLARLHYPWAPVSLLQDFQLNNIQKIASIRCPLFVIHGTSDETCLHEMGKKVFDAAAVRKEFFSVPGGNHNDLMDLVGAEYFDRSYRFFFQ